MWPSDFLLRLTVLLSQAFVKASSATYVYWTLTRGTGDTALNFFSASSKRPSRYLRFPGALRMCCVTMCTPCVFLPPSAAAPAAPLSPGGQYPTYSGSASLPYRTTKAHCTPHSQAAQETAESTSRAVFPVSWSSDGTTRM